MMDSFFILLLFSGFRLALPLMFAAYGGYFSERSGVAQISLEAFLLVGAFSAASTAYYTQSATLSFLIAGIVSLLFAQIFCVLVLVYKSHSIVVGTGLNLLAIGLIPIVSKTLFNSTGSTPSHQLELSKSALPFIILGLTVVISTFLSEKTIWGLQMKFAGEKKAALEAIGVSVRRRQWQSISYGAFVTGLGGAILSTYMASSYSPLMSAGRGFIALAAVIFSGWKIHRAVLICFLFGLFEALQIQLQSNQSVSAKIPAEFIQMIPYMITLLALFLLKEKNQSPHELK
jgi:general nucleoside transport system permease protein